LEIVLQAENPLGLVTGEENPKRCIHLLDCLICHQSSWLDPTVSFQSLRYQPSRS